MPAASTSAQPLVYKTKRHKKKSWWTRKVSEPLAKFSPAALWSGNRGPGTARSIYINTDLPESFFDKKGRVLKENKYDSNQNVTSKYTVITFLPRNLLEQFRRIANIFFLAIAILQFFPKFSTISPGLVILPLLAVLAITALKDGYEDIKRHQADHKVNHSIVHVLGGPGYENKNPMQPKAKTFIKGIPLPKMKSRKGKKGKASTAAELEGDRTLEEPQRDSEPQGQDLARMRSQVSNWNEDPEAGDTPNELGWHRTIWEDIKVGDVVKIYENEQFPADIAILATSEEEDVCYIETKNLDGETNLKSRHGINDLSHLSTADACSRERLRLDLDAPDVNMYRLNGAVLTLDSPGHDGQPAIHPITLETTLLRGCVLKNTAWVTGIVLFTGGDTKIIRNSGATPSKRSKVERQMNPQVLLNLSLLGLIAMVCAIIDHFNEVTWYDQNAYWEQFADTSGDNPNINGLVTFANAFITFQNIVPISLYISIEFVRTAQAAFIYWDHAIKYVKNGVTTRTTARSWNLSDDLGQIEYIFSDKTGTLTQNAMIFRQCSVGGKIYKGDGETPAGTLTNGQNGEKDVKKSSSGSSDSASSTGPSAGNDDVKVHLPKEVLAPFHDAQLDRDLEDHDSEQSRVLHGFFAVLGLCHTVLAAEPEPGVIEYKAQSPDEAALVQSAADVGFVFRGRDHNIVKLSTPFNDEPDEYELLHVLEFNSTRKRMSVILRKMDQDGRIFLLVKGADNIIFDRLNKDAAQKELRDKTDKDLQYFASEGLRTLCLAYRVIDPQEYEQWARDYHDASVALNDREGKVEAVSARIEQDLVLLGATAIEDKLQDGVPEAISDLKRAGIKVWVATGDKLETAVAIGYTTHLLTPDTNLIIVREGAHSIQQQISDALETFFGEEGLAITRTLSRASVGDLRPRLDRVNTGVRSLVGGDNGTRPGGFSLVIDGHALTHAFDDEETNDLLLALSTRCVTVICCRVSPLQKAQIVRLIKDNLGVMCLAIGDGANDVSMIQAADVGVGISGEEGLQAVNSSDYAIAQFRYLKRLLFVHGHWSYYRNSNMILNFFYKNIIGIGVLFWYQIYCGWSTTYVFAYVYLLFWNVFWTIAPVIAIGLFDRNADAETLMALPELYRYGREQKYYGMRMFIYYIMEGWYQAAVIYFFLHFTYITTTARGDGYDVYIYEMSTTMAIAAVMVANLFHALNIDHWNWWTLGAIALGPFLVWVFTAVYSVIPPSSFYTGVYGNDVFLFRSAFFWFGVPFVVVVALLPRYLYRTFRVNLKPNDMETMRLVRRYRSDINPYTHPLLAGKLQEKGVDEGVDAAQADAHADVEAGRTDAIPMSEFEQGYSMASQPSSPVTPKKGRTSLQSQRSTGRFGQNPAARGSQVDMSTGLSREPSRGFDFTVEEGGVAIQRMQSRLSETSRRRQPFRLTLKPITAGQATTASNSDPWGSRIRQRAGSVLSIGPLGRKRANTGATTGTQGSDTADQPQPRTPRKGSILGGSRDPKTPSKTGERKGSKEKDVREGKEAAAEQREKEEIGRAERDDEEGSAQGMGRALGAGQQYAPPEVPRV